MFGGQGFTVYVSGASFSANSVAQWNGTNRQTIYISSSSLSFPLTAADLANIGTANVTVFTPAPGGGSSAALAFTIAGNPVPSISSLSPAATVVGSPSAFVSIYGFGFLPSSVVQVNGASLPSSYVSSQLLTMTIPSTDLQNAGSLAVSVTNPSPGGGSSTPANFGVSTTPIPSIASLSPSAAAVGSAGMIVTVYGTGFSASSIVQWNGSARPTTLTNQQQLTFSVSSADLQALGNNSVTVVNPSPGGGTSSPAAFTAYVSLPNNDVEYDPTRALLWASIPSSAGPSIGNSIVSIDPYTGVLGTPIWAGSEPNKLSISDDGSTAWLSFLGSPSVVKVDLNAGKLTATHIYFPGGWGGNVYAQDLAAMPGTNSTVAVTAGNVAIYDDATARSNTGNGQGAHLAFGANAGTLYGFSNGLSIYTVDQSGISSVTNPPNSSTNSTDLRYDSGRLYLTGGGVLDGITGNLIATLAAVGPVTPDSAGGRAFILNNPIPFYAPNQMTAFDWNTFTPISSFGVGVAAQSGFSSLHLWGQNGLVFRTSNQIYVLRDALVQDLSATPADLGVSVSAPSTASTGSSITIQLTVTNSGPFIASGVSLLDSVGGLRSSCRPRQAKAVAPALQLFDATLGQSRTEAAQVFRWS